MRHAHKNTLIDVNGEKTDEFMDKYKFLIFEFKTQQIVEEIETYIYDYVGLLTAIGGNLGLLLGFSCLSIMLEILDKIARINVKKSFWEYSITLLRFFGTIIDKFHSLLIRIEILPIIKFRRL